MATVYHRNCIIQSECEHYLQMTHSGHAESGVYRPILRCKNEQQFFFSEIWEMFKIIFEIWDCKNYGDVISYHFYFCDLRKLSCFSFVRFKIVFILILRSCWERVLIPEKMWGKLLFRFEIKVKNIPPSGMVSMGMGMPKINYWKCISMAIYTYLLIGCHG